MLFCVIRNQEILTDANIRVVTVDMVLSVLWLCGMKAQQGQFPAQSHFFFPFLSIYRHSHDQLLHFIEKLAEMSPLESGCH